MNRKQSYIDQDSPTKTITDEQLNQCMEFCTMYNILYAMHQFPIPLKNINPNQKTQSSKFSKPQLQTSKDQSGKLQAKKTSKFQKPKVTKKQLNSHSKTPANYQTSQVDNYAYQSDEIEGTETHYNKPKIAKPIQRQDKKQSIEESPQIDLVALISGLAVGSNSHKNGTSDSSLFGRANQRNAAMYKNEEQDYVQSRLYQQEYTQNARDQGYQNYENQQNTWSSYANEYQKSKNFSPYQNNSNPYSKANYQNPANYQHPYNVSAFMLNSPANNSFQPTKSPYTTQIRTLNNEHQYETTSNISKNLFNQAFTHQPPNQVNQSFDPFGYQGKNLNQMQYKTSHYGNPSHNAFEQHHSKIHQNPFESSYLKSARRDFEEDRSNYPNMNYNQSNYPVQNTPPKTLNPSQTQRSLSPLANSASCRNFFAQTQKQISVDRSGASRSKSGRKQKPGGSKSFYKPSLSARKVLSKQKPEQQRDYDSYSRHRDYSEHDDRMQDRPSQFNGYNREEEEDTRENKKKAMAPTQYPRNTGETDFSALSGWQQANQPQKSTKSQQIITNKNMEVKRINKPLQNQERDSPRLGHEIQQRYDENQQSNEIDLDDLDEQMQKLNASRRKVPKPITEVDLTNARNPKVKQKR